MKPGHETKIMPHITKYLGLDCETVPCGPRGTRSCLARVSIVNEYGDTVYDTYVKPSEPVTSFNFQHSSLTSKLLGDGQCFEIVQMFIENLIRSRVVVGYDLEKGFKALRFSYPYIRDMATYRPFVKINGGKKPSLQTLAFQQLGKIIHTKPYDSLENARTAMEIFQTTAKVVPTSMEYKKLPINVQSTSYYDKCIYVILISILVFGLHILL